MVSRGTILFHKNFVYEDGTAGRKYLILLNTPKKNDPYLVVKTTSQRKNKPQTAGCIERLSLFFIPARTAFFPVDTWVQLYSLEAVDQDYATKSPHIEEVGNLKQEVIAGIIDCLLKTQGDDIPAYQMKLLKPPVDSKIKELKALWDRHRN